MKYMEVVIYTFFIFCFNSIGSFGQTPDPPNIILIMADDLGLGIYSVHPHSKIKTVYLDSMYFQGMRFTNIQSYASIGMWL